MVEIRTGIKVCREDIYNKMISAFSDGHKTEYKLGEWVDRPFQCGPLAVFDNIYNAHMSIPSLSRKGTSKFAFVCEYVVSEEAEVYTKYYHPIFTMGLPKGTKLADKVKLIHKL